MHRKNPHSLPPIPTHPHLITPASESQPSSPDIVVGQTSQYAAIDFIDNNTDPPGTVKTTSLRRWSCIERIEGLSANGMIHVDVGVLSVVLSMEDDEGGKRQSAARITTSSRSSQFSSQTGTSQTKKDTASCGMDEFIVGCMLERRKQPVLMTTQTRLSHGVGILDFAWKRMMSRVVRMGRSEKVTTLFAYGCALSLSCSWMAGSSSVKEMSRERCFE
jgi:hypothetical protein